MALMAYNTRKAALTAWKRKKSGVRAVELEK